MSDSPVPIGTTESAPSMPQVHGRFFSARDSIAFLLASVVSFAVYLCTLAPGVTLENAGELLTASHSLGVPHPPGTRHGHFSPRFVSGSFPSTTSLGVST